MYSFWNSPVASRSVWITIKFEDDLSNKMKDNPMQVTVQCIAAMILEEREESARNFDDAKDFIIACLNELYPVNLRNKNEVVEVRVSEESMHELKCYMVKIIAEDLDSFINKYCAGEYPPLEKNDDYLASQCLVFDSSDQAARSRKRP
ncbi:MAG: hypothetical protein SFW66_02130 [Gammaproteobacteria bacterium]|nr:hypothetical protein [Gammaproteobacteria bacterium]